jgi:endonuclease/exonuclease/phosphatase family metal-dependent hydrolase
MPSADLSGAAGTPGEHEAQIYPTSTEKESVSVLTWNIEWLGDSENGPSDEMRQLSLANEALSFAKPDIVGLQELSSPAAAASLVASLPGYALSLAHYEQRQKLALLYREERVELLEVAAIEGLEDAGRPPLEAHLRTRAGRELTVIVVHAKAGDDPRSYQTRARFAQGLRAYLQAHHLASDLIVLGDFNDLFEASTLEGSPSPYESLTASGMFVAVTAPLETQAERSTKWGATVDHIVLSRSLVASIVPDSIETLRDELLARHPDFFEAASDHAPVALELAL